MVNGSSRLFVEISVEDRHGEVEGAVAILVVDEEHTDKLLTDIDLRRIVLLGTTYDPNRVVRECLAEVALDFRHLGFVHTKPFPCSNRLPLPRAGGAGKGAGFERQIP